MFCAIITNYVSIIKMVTIIIIITKIIKTKELVTLCSSI